MLKNIAKLFFGSKNDRTLKRLKKTVAKINALEPEMQGLSDDELKNKTTEFKARLDKKEKLDNLLPEAFAVVRETAKRTLGMRPFDVQLIGGMVLNEGDIAEMATGEGKTLTAALPIYLNALTGKGVHLVTVNDYLAKRDAEWMKPIYEFLGMTVGVNLTGMQPEEKQKAFACDITYGTNNEFGFDYLRDNMAFSPEERVLRPLHFAIVDEVDSILIDEARTPLIISGSADESSELYKKVNQIIPKLKVQPEEETEENPGDGDYYLDEKTKQAFLTERGHKHVEKLLFGLGLINEGDSLYDAKNIGLMHHTSSALRAHGLYVKDVDYIVKDNEIVIVDEHTGRTMPGRRWSEGLHQAVEAKEGVLVQAENQTLASITFQNFFRMYEKLAGMTGTADTEAYEFKEIYNLDVVVIPTNKPCARDDAPDLIYLTAKEKFDAIIEDVKTRREKGQPSLVGTVSIETSEYVASLLNKENIPHQVLNAKFHEQEAQVIAQAGRPGTVTIATNMAGRGTDIVLGGSKEEDEDQAQWQARHEQVLKSGGLHIIGTERHESRRIDNQLRGRAGRQGDNGSSRFYLSLEDNLMRIFASEKVAAIMQKFGMKDGEALEHSWITKSIENAQRKVENHNFDIRKQLLDYDNVANDQRKVIYRERNDIMDLDNVSDYITAIRKEAVDNLVSMYVPPESFEEQWDIPGLTSQIHNDFQLKLPLQKWLDEDNSRHEKELREYILEEISEIYKAKEIQVGEEVMRGFEKSVVLQSLDTHWKDHLSTMDHLRQGIHLRGYAQQDPKREYQREAYKLFSEMLEAKKHDVISVLSTVQVQAEDDVAAMEEQRRQAGNLNMSFQHAQAQGMGQPEMDANQEEAKILPFKRDEAKVGRNEPCPCGSGKKYKTCHGKIH